MLKHLTEADVQAIIEAAERPISTLSERDALAGAIKRLSHVARMELMALMWHGRGDTDLTFAEHLKRAHQISHEGDADYIAAKSPLAKYLREGLKKLSSEARLT